MDYKLLDQFSSKRAFINTSLKTCSISFNYLSKKVSALDGIFEQLLEIPENTVDLNNSELCIRDIIPAWYYRKIAFKILQFYSLKKRKTTHDYVISYVASNNSASFISNGKWLINLHLNDLSCEVSISACEASAAGNLNEKLLIISESKGQYNGRIIFATNLFSKERVHLQNNEYDVLQLLSKGYSSEAIADLIFVSKHTADDYRKELLRKFKAVNIYQLIKHAQQEGFI